MRLKSTIPAILSALAVLAVGLAFAPAAPAQYDPPGGDDPGGGGGECDGENIVRVRDSVFQPATINIEVGEVVTWCYDGASMAHNVVAPGAFRCAHGCDHSSGDGTPSTGWSFSLQFDQAETINYFCEVHRFAGMTGRVVVSGGDGGGGGGGGGGNGAGTFTVSRRNVSVAESAGQVAIGVTRGGGDDGAVSVQVATSGGSATAGQDFGSTSTTVNFSNNEDGTKNVNVPILNDSDDEPDESFTVGLSNATGGASVGNPSETTVTIIDDDEAPQGPGTLSFGSFAFAGVEGRGQATVEVIRTGGATGAVSAQWATAGGSATSNSDYAPGNGTVMLGNGVRRATLTIPILDDDAVEDLEAFSVSLSNPGGGASLGTTRRATVFVFDDDAGPVILSADEVLCDGFRLAALFDRLGLEMPNGSGPPGVNLTFSRLGDFAGIAYTGNGPGTPEHHLAFSTNPEETSFLRNPARPQLFALSMSRNQTNSDLVPAGSPDALRVTLDPTLGGDPDPLSLLTIDDLGDPVSRQGGTPAESKPGRGLEDAVRPCHGPLSARDQHVFQVLAKVARLTADGASGARIGIYRGQTPDTFRLDAYPLDGAGEPLGRLAVELEIDFGPGDRLDGGTLRVLDRCGPDQSAGCTSVTGFTEMQLVAPPGPGEFWNDGPWAVSTSGVQGDGQPTANVDFAALLAGTSWRRPL